MVTAILEKEQEKKERQKALEDMAVIMNHLDIRSILLLQGGAHMLLARQQAEKKREKNLTRRVADKEGSR